MSKAVKKHLPTPVVLIDESEQFITSKLVEDKSVGLRGVFPGGFKNKDSQYQKVSQNASIETAPLSKITVYDQFGIVNDSVAHMKQPAQPIVKSTLQSTFKPPFKTQSQYILADIPGRKQVASHIQSSLDVIDLDGIEAKIAAHRAAFKPIEDQYNLSKGKQGETKQNKFKFNIDVDSELKEIDGPRIYELIKINQQKQLTKDPEKLTLEELWEQKKLENPKIAEYDYKYQTFLIEKEAKGMIGKVFNNSLYSWDKYATKDQLEKRQKLRKSKSKDRVFSKSKEKMQLTLTPTPNALKQDLEEVLASKDDKFISQFIVAEIDEGKKGMISKEELSEYIESKEHIRSAYHIDLKWLYTDLDNFNTKRKGMLTKEQVALFLATLDRLHHPQMQLVDPRHPKKELKISTESYKPFTSYFEENKGYFSKLFAAIDVNDDRIVKREEFIASIYGDSYCSNLLDKPVLVINTIGKALTFRQMIGWVLNDYRTEKNEKLKKSKEYITFARFKQYFEVPESIDLSAIEKNNQPDRESSLEHEIYDIDPECLGLLKDIFDTIPRVYQQYIVAHDFVGLALKDPQIMALSDELCRIKSVETELPVESIRQTITRMLKECDVHANWDILKLYFSRRGRPLDWDYTLIQKKKELRDQKLQSLRKDQAITGLMNNSVRLASSGLKHKSRDKYTIPKPFNIADERPKSSMPQMSSEMRELQELKKKFKARPVPQDVLESKPNLIAGKIAEKHEPEYNYQNYENDRIERTLKKAEERLRQEELVRQIKKNTEVKAKGVKIDLKKTMNEVISEQKKKEQTKPTVPIDSHLYPKNPQESHLRKVEKVKNKMDKADEAEKLKEEQLEKVRQKAKERNDSKANLKKEKDEEERKNQQIIGKNGPSFKPTVNSHKLSDKDKQLMEKAKFERERKQMQEQQKMLQFENERRKKRLDFKRKDKKSIVDDLTDEEIIERIDEIDFEDLLLCEEDKNNFREDFNLKAKTKKQCREFFSGVALREKATMEVEDRRIAENAMKIKSATQEEFLQSKHQQTVDKNANSNGALEEDTNFHRSKALRRYRALMQERTPNSEFDKQSIAGKQRDP